jgi:hypothetical protein
MENIKSPAPKETGTSTTGKPLGGWETKRIDKGVFVARPGVYFPMNPTADEIKDVRGRGVGKSVVLENSKMIVESWEKYGQSRTVHVGNVRRFCGAKSSISRSGKMRNFSYKRSPLYGRWIVREVEMSFDPLPKREKVNADGVTLALRQLPGDLESTPYDNAVKSRETVEAKMLYEELLEQPDADFQGSAWEEELGGT